MRHFGKFIPTKEEIAILGYNRDRNDLMVCFLSGIPAEEAQKLRGIIQSADAQSKDYLMCKYSGNVLASAHHPSGHDWETHAINQVVTKAGGNRPYRTVSIKDVLFLDKAQEAFYKGYGPSIEPEIEEIRQRNKIVRDGARHGQSIHEIDHALASHAAKNATNEVTSTGEVAAVTTPPVDDKLNDTLTMMAQTQMLMLQQLQKLGESMVSNNAPVEAPPRRKPGRKPKNPVITEE